MKVTYINLSLNIIQKRSCSRKFNSKSWNIVFFGNDSFSLISLQELIKQRTESVVGNLEVVTSNIMGPVYKYSVRQKIKIHIWPAELNGFYDLGIIASFGKLIPRKIIGHFQLGIINVHASLLPKWRGPAPIIHAIMNGDDITGITIQKINPYVFDTGDVIMKKICQIGKNEVMPSLYNRLSKMGSECLRQVILEIPYCFDRCCPQENEKASYAKKLSKDVTFVKWNESTAKEVYNLYRALFGLYYLRTSWNGILVKLICLSLCDSDKIFMGNTFIVAGNIHFNSELGELLVMCKDKPIKVCTVSINGKLYYAKQFFRGFLSQQPKTTWVFGS